jgi:putative glutamine amidotransferase
LSTSRTLSGASWRSSPDRPIVGVTPDVFDRSERRTQSVSSAYLDRIVRAGGVPIVLTAHADLVPEHARLCDAFVLTGGDDPRTEPFGEPSDPRITPIFPERQEYETALLRVLMGDGARGGAPPVLGICLGMQMMALVAGGTLDQHMPASVPTHADHMGRDHDLIAEANAPFLPARGTVHSHHKQAVRDPGGLRVLARAHDGVIEAIGDLDRPFLLGVQWHPERTESPALGQVLFDRLVEAARSS